MENEEDSYSPSDLSPNGERPSKRRRMSAHPPREVGLMRSVPGDKFSSFVGSASGIYFIRSVYRSIRGGSHPTASAPIETPESDIVPGEDDHLPSMLPNTSGRLWTDDEITTRSLINVSFQELVEWSGSYFANWHPAYPFLHAPTILERFEEISRNGALRQDASQEFQMTIIRSIMSISLADHRQSPRLDRVHYPASLVFQSYDAALGSLHYVLSRPTSIHSLQAAISVLLFLISMLRLNAASRLGGLVLRMALQLGLHRCPNRFPSFSASERELRQRIFWSLYAIDRFVCQSMGLPLSLHDDDIDVCYPISERHGANEDTPDDRLRLLDLLARHSEIRGQIMELRNKSIHYVQKDPHQATTITAKLAQWWNDVEDFNDSDDDQNPSAYQLTVLTILRHESIISLNRPILAASHHGPAYDAALQQCIGSARAIITTLHDAINAGGARNQNSEPSSLLWPSCTWAVWISSFILFHAANGKHISQRIVSRFADRSLEILQHLSRRGSVWPEASAAAIRDLRVQMMNRQSKSPRTVNASSGNGPDRDVYQSSRTTAPHAFAHRRSIMINASASENISGQSLNAASSNTRQSSTGVTNNTLRPSTTSSTGTSARDSRDMDTIQPSTSSQPSFGTGQDPHPEAYNSLDSNLSFNFETADLGNFMQANGMFEQSADMLESDGIDPFSGFDIPFWLGQDQNWGMFHDRN